MVFLYHSIFNPTTILLYHFKGDSRRGTDVVIFFYKLMEVFGRKFMVERATLNYVIEQGLLR